MDLNGPGDADVWADVGGLAGELAGLLRVGRGKVSVQLSRVAASVQLYGGPVEVDAETAARLVPRFEGFVLVEAWGDGVRGCVAGEYVLAGPAREPWGIERLRGTFLGRAAVFRLRDLLPRGTAALAGNEVVCDGEWNRGELRGHLLREFRPQARLRLRAFLRGSGRRGASVVRTLPRDVLAMIAAGVPLPFTE